HFRAVLPRQPPYRSPDEPKDDPDACEWLLRQQSAVQATRRGVGRPYGQDLHPRRQVVQWNICQRQPPLRREPRV
ncbi:hypothetical protein BN1708_018903, partial [Verticillium longisporum]